MNIPLPIHLSIHVILSLLVGLLVWIIWKKPALSFLGAILGGVLVDLDHFIDYFLAFGIHWNLEYFNNGYQFLKTDKIYIFFHGWEYVIILLLATILAKNKCFKTIFFSVALGLFFHLCADVLIDRMPPSSYSIVYRAENHFDAQKLVYPENWQEHLKQKETIKLN